MNKEEFIEKATNVHGNIYDYSKVEYINNHTDVTIICPVHGEFKQKPKCHLRGCGCKKCKQRNYVYTTEEFIQKALEVHGRKYDYGKVNYISARVKVCITCPTHGDFWQEPCSHLQGRGCEKCVRPSYDTKSFIECAKKVHGEKYDYSKVNYINTRTKVCVICPKHGAFMVKPNVHLQGCGCNLCLNKDEEKLFVLLVERYGIDNVSRQKSFPWLLYENHKQYLDFYLEKENVAIELQGPQHFMQHRYWDKDNSSFLRRNKLDINKKNLCEKHGIKLIYFTFNKDWNVFLGEKVKHDISDIAY